MHARIFCDQNEDVADFLMNAAGTLHWGVVSTQQAPRNGNIASDRVRNIFFVAHTHATVATRKGGSAKLATKWLNWKIFRFLDLLRN